MDSNQEENESYYEPSKTKIFKENMKGLFEKVDNKFLDQFKFRIKETSFIKIVEYLHGPRDSSSLAVTRILFGLSMLFDIPDERGGAIMVERWGDSKKCHFPLVPFITAIPMLFMALVYAALWIGALCIMLGYKFRITAPIFTICYWYLFLIEKSYWNNHSYLFGLVGLLLCFTNEHCRWSLDAYLNPKIVKTTVPYWNYFILKYQFFILYFMAGVKKGTAEWLAGYSMMNLSSHWVFAPFRLFLSVPQIDYIIVHWFIFVFDLTVAFWMMWERTRHVAMIFCALFHLMNSRLFRIGMFPWVCLATMPLFYPFDWPMKMINFLEINYTKAKKSVANRLSTLTNTNLSKNDVQNGDAQNCELNEEFNDANEVEENSDTSAKSIKDNTTNNAEILDTNSIKQKKDLDTDSEESITNTDNDRCKILTTLLIIVYVLTQAFLPFSHFITKGYNNWTNGLYGYSWDMMVHNWDTNSVTVKIVDNKSKKEYFMDPDMYAPNERWTTHGDMALQYAHCLKDKIVMPVFKHEDVSIHFDIWTSLNGRFTQRIFDPNVDILKSSWSVFDNVPFLMPLLDDEGLNWRSVLLEIKEEVTSRNNNSEVLFLADFPGYELEKYLAVELMNITLTVLRGRIFYEPEVLSSVSGHSHILTTGDSVEIHSGMFHRVVTVGESPSFYMYAFVNTTATHSAQEITKPMLPIFKELSGRFRNMYRFGVIVFRSIYQITFGCNDCFK